MQSRDGCSFGSALALLFRLPVTKRDMCGAWVSAAGNVLAAGRKIDTFRIEQNGQCFKSLSTRSSQTEILCWNPKRDSRTDSFWTRNAPKEAESVSHCNVAGTSLSWELYLTQNASSNEADKDICNFETADKCEKKLDLLTEIFLEEETKEEKLLCCQEFSKRELKGLALNEKQKPEEKLMLHNACSHDEISLKENDSKQRLHEKNWETMSSAEDDSFLKQNIQTTPFYGNGQQGVDVSNSSSSPNSSIDDSDTSRKETLQSRQQSSTDGVLTRQSAVESEEEDQSFRSKLDGLDLTMAERLKSLRASCGMSTAEFRERGKQMVDYIADYMDSISERRVTPAVEPGYLRDIIPDNPPDKPESWAEIMKDVENKIMPGVTHWQHPRFHAYFPAGNSWPSILGDMLSDAIGCVGFSWAASPACTELETIMLDWIARMINLPPDFRPFVEEGRGGGVLQGSASDCILVCMLTARACAIRHYKEFHDYEEDGIILSKLVAYCSKEAHSSVEKAAMVCLVKIRILETDSDYSLRGEVLAEAIREDKEVGLIPFFVCATLGTTSCCSFDNLSEIGPVCENEGIWLHVDAAYAGSALICPEFQYLLRGAEHASSFNMNPNKWMLVNFDCSTMWVKDRYKLTDTLAVDPLYLQHRYTDKAIDYRHWGLPLSRRFRALKLWFVIRSYGVHGLQVYIRKHVRLAKLFESLVKKDSRFEIPCKVTMGLVCFRLKVSSTSAEVTLGHSPSVTHMPFQESNAINQRLLMCINASGELHMVPASLNNRYVIRFAVCAENATEKDIHIAWRIIQTFATEVYQRSRSKGSGSFELPGELKFAQENGLSSSNEEELEEIDEVDEVQDEVFYFEPNFTPHSERTQVPRRRPGPTRNMLVRMISDPKCYHPKVWRTLHEGVIKKRPILMRQNTTSSGTDTISPCTTAENSSPPV